MKNFTKQLVLFFVTTFIGMASNAQNINFTFANAQKTNDGSNTYYEADVLISSTTPFKLGSGQLYFNYNTAAFGTNVKNNNAFTATQPNADGYICGQYVDAAAASIYSTFTVNDNTASRVSWAFSQAFSTSTFANNNVTSTPTKLIHIKIKFVDANADPNVRFEDGEVFDDQFFIACGSSTNGPFDAPDCTNFPGIQLKNDTYDSSMATLSTKTFEPALAFTVYPNPATNVINVTSKSVIKSINVFDLLGKQVISSSKKQIDISNLKSGIYIVKINSNTDELTKKIIKN